MILTTARKFVQEFLNLVIPPACISCNQLVSEQGQICGKCWKDITVIDRYACAKCGLPFEIDLGKNAKCPACLAEKPSFSKAVSVCKYEGTARKLAVRLKFGDKTNLAPYIAKMMFNMGRGMIEKSDLITPIPLHWRRKFFRKYNQSGLLAAEVAKMSGLNYQPNLLKRVKHTRQQTRLSKLQRKRNVKNVFSVGKSNIEGKTILLIDDVATTCATLNSAARALKKAGAKKVYALTFARVTTR